MSVSDIIDTLKSKLSRNKVSQNEIKNELALLDSVSQKISTSKVIQTDDDGFRTLVEFCLVRQHCWNETICQDNNNHYQHQKQYDQINMYFQNIMNSLETVPLSPSLFKSIVKISQHTNNHAVRNRLYTVCHFVIVFFIASKRK